MIYLDTHVMLWLYEGDVSRFSPKAKNTMNNKELMICPMVFMELQYLHEVGRSKIKADKIYRELNTQLDINLCETSFAKVVQHASKLKWTRDPFDRLIVAHAEINQFPLLTKDETIHRH